jgi:hypothetical protein
MNIEQLRTELNAAGLNFYAAGLDETGQLYVRFLQNNLKRLPTPDEQEIIEAVVAAHNPILSARAEGAIKLNEWRGNKRKALGLTEAWGQELVYSGKMMMALRWLEDQESTFYFAQEAEARELSDLEIAELIVDQGNGWLLGSDAIEAEYFTAKVAVEAGESQAEIDAVLEGLS